MWVTWWSSTPCTVENTRKNKNLKPGPAVVTYSPSTWEAEAGHQRISHSWILSGN
jgi:hypothetical protein